MRISPDVRLAAAMVVGLVCYLVTQHSDPSTMVVGLFSYFVTQHSNPSTKDVVARYAEELKAIGTEVPAGEKASLPREPASRLAWVRSSVEIVETIARGIEQALATKSAGCEFAEAAGDAIEKAIPAAVATTNNVLDRLFVEAEQRYSSLTKENEALGWVGWRGSREQEIQELVLFAHDITITSHNTDLAFDRLQANASALNKLASTCKTVGNPTENRAAVPNS